MSYAKKWATVPLNAERAPELEPPADETTQGVDE